MQLNHGKFPIFNYFWPTKIAVSTQVIVCTNISSAWEVEAGESIESNLSYIYSSRPTWATSLKKIQQFPRVQFKFK